MVKASYSNIIGVVIFLSIFLDDSFGWVFSTVPVRASVESQIPASTTATVEDTAWDILAGNIGVCLIKSDLKRDSGFDGSSTGWTSWVEASSAFRLQKCMDKLIFVDSTNKMFNLTSDQDDLVRWLKWIKSSPSPMIVELSEQLRTAVNATITPKLLDQVVQSSDEFLSRISCRIVLLPSGSSLRSNLRTAAGAMVYGKILYGGGTRYRLIGSSTRNKRKAGERTAIASQGEATEAWLQYGGPERNYDSLDMGPCAIMELTILPKGLNLPLIDEDEANTEMSVLKVQCNPSLLFEFPNTTTNDNITAADKDDTNDEDVQDALSESEMEYLEGLESTFSTVLGGLGNEIESIVRRVLDGRAMTQKSGSAAVRAKEMQLMLDLGLQPVKGLLLYGPPGCGKTALAREISRLLTERPPKIVSAPELLDRWVGGSEKLVRDLFGDAEAELKRCNGDITKSGLHVVVIDEVDAVFRKRSSASDSGEVARASAVNQILAKLDGVNSLGNVLVVGTTNRKELLDDALLRPGRLEVQVEVPLPDKKGRREILQIHFDALRKRGRLSKPLCEAIDGVAEQATGGVQPGKFPILWRFSALRHRSRSLKDLAADRWTNGFSGADLEGLVRCAGSIALARARKDGSGVDGLLVTVDDVMKGLDEVKE
jgi:vesicle-fusing ATPase